MSTVILNKQQKNNSLTVTLLWVSRLFVGLLFIFSGLIKANDPMGFGFKLQEYFHVFHLDILNDYSALIAIFICAFEIIFGFLLILGTSKNTVAWGLLLLILFFTFLTFYSAFFEVVTSCGCFGDAIPLTPWQSFIKDLILLAFIVFIFIHRQKITRLIRSKALSNLLTFLVVICSFGLGFYTLNFLPIKDFLPYNEGASIPEKMRIPENAEPDVYKHEYELKNKSTNQTKTVTDKEYIGEKLWEDENWEIVGEPKSTLVKRGFEPEIPDLVISDAEGNNVTSEILENPYYNFIVVSKNVGNLSQVDFVALDKINQTIREISEDYTSIRAILLSASTPQQIDFLSDQMDLVLESFNADLVPLKSMVRSDPGVMLLQNGKVIKKWSKYSFPDKEELEEKYLK